MTTQMDRTKEKLQCNCKSKRASNCLHEVAVLCRINPVLTYKLSTIRRSTMTWSARCQRNCLIYRLLSETCWSRWALAWACHRVSIRGKSWVAKYRLTYSSIKGSFKTSIRIQTLQPSGSMMRVAIILRLYSVSRCNSSKRPPKYQQTSQVSNL